MRGENSSLSSYRVQLPVCHMTSLRDDVTSTTCSLICYVVTHSLAVKTNQDDHSNKTLSSFTIAFRNNENDNLSHFCHYRVEELT